MPQHSINLDPQWLSLIGKKYAFTDLLATHPSLMQLGLMMITSIIFDHDALPEFGLWTPTDPENVYYYSVIRLKIDKANDSTDTVPTSLLQKAGISPAAQQILIDSTAANG
ncbi:MAG: hypothetical protein Q7L07_18645 [Pseudohongiella sp.]|nr:hypothetical protein [Pseudohongiella sp.]